MSDTVMMMLIACVSVVAISSVAITGMNTYHRDKLEIQLKNSDEENSITVISEDKEIKK